MTRARLTGAGLAAVGAVGCATLTTARPLEPGEHALGVVAGGGLVDLGAPIPLPVVSLEGRHGVARVADRPVDVGWGVDATALAFGVVAVHGSSSILLFEQARARPALSLSDRLWFATNVVGLPSKPDPQLQAWLCDQVELTASWKLGQQLGYVALAQYVDFGNPTLTLTPAVGGVFDFREPGGVALQAEVRWFGLGVADTAETVDWIPGGTGILGVSLGLSSRFGWGR